ncbi:hypothetical protein H0H81_005445 [Sphagnurus paluster]|uniref:F-box domain-containing protein n=1 Tax=Sphagnurus paluster TaxID=117069 RepID=A0A9P7FVS3_9AGAR|nr:hypothetical protein H0H81_005445 [Sphagnurus paluster]
MELLQPAEALLVEKVNTNYIPTYSEKQEILDVLKAPLAHLACLEEEIAHFDLLLQQRDSLKQGVKAYQDLLSPARRILPEILQEIFIHCLPEDRNQAMSAKEAPLLLGLVCRSWRRLSIACPRLWSSIHIPVLYNTLFSIPIVGNEQTPRLRNDAVKRWLDRSGNCPLTISLKEMPASSGPVDLRDGIDPGSGLAKLLIGYSRRWKKIELTCLNSLSQFTTLAAKDVPVLESLSISSSPLRKGDDPSKTTLFRAPRLRTLRLCYMSGDILKYHVSWADLTDLHLDRHARATDREPFKITPEIALALLGRCHSLERCRLDIAAPAVRHTQRSVHLPHLIELWITVQWETKMLMFFKSLFAPALKHFRFRNSERIQDIKFPGLGLLPRCLELDTLTLNPCILTEAQIIECLRWCPTITTLNILGGREIEDYALDIILSLALVPSFSDNVLEFLTPGSPAITKKQPCLCPMLRSFHCDRQNSISDEGLVRFLKAREAGQSQGIAPLDTVVFAFDRLPKLDVKAALAAEGFSCPADMVLKYVARKGLDPTEGLYWLDEY